MVGHQIVNIVNMMRCLVAQDIYQITDVVLCQDLIGVVVNGVDVTKDGVIIMVNVLQVHQAVYLPLYL